MKAPLAWMLGATCLLHSGLAAACIALTPVWVVTTIFPVAEGVALNAPVVVHFENVARTVDSSATGYFSPTLTLRATGSAVALPTVKVGLSWDQAAVQAFVPTVPLLPATEYTVDVGSGGDFPEQAPHVFWTFTTGDAPRPPLAFAGELSGSMSLGTAPHLDCVTPLCGEPVCTEQGVDDVWRARLHLPAAFDGFSDQYLKGSLKVTEEYGDPQQQIAGQLLGEIAQGEASDFDFSLLAQAGMSRVPCFTYTVSDARGDELSTSWCADAMPSQPNDSIAVPNDRAQAGPHTSSACALRVPGEGDTKRGGCLLGLLVLPAMARRYRRTLRTRATRL